MPTVGAPQQSLLQAFALTRFVSWMNASIDVSEERYHQVMDHLREEMTLNVPIYLTSPYICLFRKLRFQSLTHLGINVREPR